MDKDNSQIIEQQKDLKSVKDEPGLADKDSDVEPSFTDKDSDVEPSFADNDSNVDVHFQSVVNECTKPQRKGKSVSFKTESGFYNGSLLEDSMNEKFYEEEYYSTNTCERIKEVNSKDEKNDLKSLDYPKAFEASSSNCPEGLEAGILKIEQNATSDDMGKDIWNGRWKDILLDYAQQTSFHGLRQITEPQPFMFRRFLWFCVFIASTVILLIQMTLSVKYYIQWPVSVDVKINYNDSIIFPAVTICNENAFQMTKAYKKGYYNLISDMFDGMSDLHLGDYNASNLSLETLYQNTAHNKSQFIVSCSWQNVECQHEFVATLTDFGLCHTFNTGKMGFPLKVAYSTGSEGGLRLQLNIEQYQYMHGPNEGAGLKVLIHGQDEIPLVRDHGLAVPPGSHAFIAIKTVDIQNLPPRHGKCNDSVTLKYFDDYSVASCYINCKEEFLNNRCSCRDVYMPPVANKPKVCTLESYQNCMINALEDFNKFKEHCECPIPCHRLAYEPTISYASTSNFDIDTLLRKNLSSLRHDYLAARGTGQKVDTDVVASDKILISNFYNNVQKMSSAMEDIRTALTGIEHSIDNLYDSVSKRTNIHLHTLEQVHLTLEKHFIRGFEVFREAIFDYVSTDYLGLANSLKRTLMAANERIDVNDTVAKKFVFAPMESLLRRRIELVSSVKQYINMTYDAYRLAIPLIPLNGGHYDKSYISPDLLSFDNINDYIGVRGQKMDNLVEFMIGRLFHAGVFGTQIALRKFIEIGEIYVNSSDIDEWQIKQGENMFIYSIKHYNDKLYQYQRYVVDIPRELIQNDISQFKIENRSLHDSYMSVKRKISEIKSSLESSEEIYWKYILHFAEASKQYINYLNSSKVTLGQMITSKLTDESIKGLQSIFNALHLKIDDLKITISNLQQSFEVIWQAMLTNRFTYPFYKAVCKDIEDFQTLEKLPLDVIIEEMNQNITFDNNSTASERNKTQYETLLLAFSELLNIDLNVTYNLDVKELTSLLNGDLHSLNISIIMSAIASNFYNISTEIEGISQIAHSDKLFLESFTNYKMSLTNFISRNEIDSRFYKENFMRLDIYMQELRYEEIIQQKAYDIIQLLGDIGGSMGLFIGGSVISIFEFFDVFVHHGFQKCLRKKSKPESTKVEGH